MLFYAIGLRPVDKIQKLCYILQRLIIALLAQSWARSRLVLTPTEALVAVSFALSVTGSLERGWLKWVLTNESGSSQALSLSSSGPKPPCEQLRCSTFSLNMWMLAMWSGMLSSFSCSSLTLPKTYLCTKLEVEKLSCRTTHCYEFRSLKYAAKKKGYTLFSFLWRRILWNV